jgi:DNA-directed RNA polymerase subunit N (RpoN/RPB10)
MDETEDGKINLVPKECWSCKRPLDKVMFRELLSDGLTREEAADKMMLPFCCRIKLMSAPFKLEDVLNEYQKIDKSKEKKEE